MKHTIPITFEMDEKWFFTVTIGKKKVPNKWFGYISENDFLFHCMDELKAIEEGYAWEDFTTNTNNNAW